MFCSVLNRFAGVARVTAGTHRVEQRRDGQHVAGRQYVLAGCVFAGDHTAAGVED